MLLPPGEADGCQHAAELAVVQRRRGSFEALKGLDRFGGGTALPASGRRPRETSPTTRASSLSTVEVGLGTPKPRGYGASHPPPPHPLPRRPRRPQLPDRGSSAIRGALLQHVRAEGNGLVRDLGRLSDSAIDHDPCDPEDLATAGLLVGDTLTFAFAEPVPPPSAGPAYLPCESATFTATGLSGRPPLTSTWVLDNGA